MVFCSKTMGTVLMVFCSETTGTVLMVFILKPWGRSSWFLFLLETVMEF